MAGTPPRLSLNYLVGQMRPYVTLGLVLLASVTANAGQASAAPACSGISSPRELSRELAGTRSGATSSLSAAVSRLFGDAKLAGPQQQCGFIIAAAPAVNAPLGLQVAQIPAAARLPQAALPHALQPRAP